MITAQNYSVLVKSTGETSQTSVGSYKYIFFRSAPYDFQFSFDGVSWFDGFEGLNMGPLPIEASAVYLRNLDTVNSDVTVKFYVSNFPILSPPDVLLSRPAPTYPIGNLGFGSLADVQAQSNYYVSGIGLAAAGTGYRGGRSSRVFVVGDILTVAGGAGTAAKIVVTNVSASGAILGAQILTPGNYSVNPATPNTPTGGGGSGAQFSLAFTHLSTATLGWVSGYLTITNAAPFTIPNTNAGNARKTITFSVAAASAGSLLVLDASGRTFTDVVAGQKLIFEDSGVFQIVAASSSLCTFTIGEDYYQ